MNALSPTSALQIRMWDPAIKRMWYRQEVVFQTLHLIHSDPELAKVNKHRIFMLASNSFDSQNQGVFEGDILEGWAGSDEFVRFQVLIRDHKFVTVDHDGVQFDLSDTDMSRFTIIGNVLQHPEKALVPVEAV